MPLVFSSSHLLRRKQWPQSSLYTCTPTPVARPPHSASSAASPPRSPRPSIALQGGGRRRSCAHRPAETRTPETHVQTCPCALHSSAGRNRWPETSWSPESPPKAWPTRRRAPSSDVSRAREMRHCGRAPSASGLPRGELGGCRSYERPEASGVRVATTRTSLYWRQRHVIFKLK